MGQNVCVHVSSPSAEEIKSRWWKLYVPLGRWEFLSQGAIERVRFQHTAYKTQQWGECLLTLCYRMVKCCLFPEAFPGCSHCALDLSHLLFVGPQGFFSLCIVAVT